MAKYFSLILGILSMWTISLNGQVTITVPPNFDDFEIEDIYQATISNIGPTAVDGRLHVYLRGNEGAVVEAFTSAIHIPAGYVMNSYEIPWSSQLNYGMTNAARRLQSSGILIPGEYIYCYEFISLADKQVLGQYCQEASNSNLLNFELIHPANGAKLNSLNPLLTWEPYWSFGNLDVAEYLLNLKHCRKGQAPYEAMSVNPVYYKSDLNVNNLFYAGNTAALEVGEQYVWQVHAIDRRGNIIASTSIWTFTIVGDNPNTSQPIDKEVSYPLISTHSTSVSYLNTGSKIRFAYDNWEHRTQLDYSIHPIEDNKTRLKELPEVGLIPGMNTIELDLERIGGMKKGASYELEIREHSKVYKMILIVK